MALKPSGKLAVAPTVRLLIAAPPGCGCARRQQRRVHADATLSTMAVKEPDRSLDGAWEAALEAVEQLTVAVSRVAAAGALQSA